MGSPTAARLAGRADRWGPPVPARKAGRAPARDSGMAALEVARALAFRLHQTMRSYFKRHRQTTNRKGTKWWVRTAGPAPKQKAKFGAAGAEGRKGQFGAYVGSGSFGIRPPQTRGDAASGARAASGLALGATTTGLAKLARGTAGWQGIRAEVLLQTGDGKARHQESTRLANPRFGRARGGARVGSAKPDFDPETDSGGYWAK